MGFENVTTDAGLAALDAFLEEHSYIEGWNLSQADVVVFEALKSAPASTKYAHAARWFNHVVHFKKSFATLPGIKKALSTYGPTTPAPVVAVAAPVAAVSSAIPVFAPSALQIAAAKGAAKPTTWEANAEPTWEDVLDEEMNMEDEDDEEESAPVAAKPATATAKKTAPAAEEEDFDLFGSDDEEEDAAKTAITAQRLKEYNEKKAAKPKPVAKSMVILDVKPWDDETDMKLLEKQVRGIDLPGLVWGTSKLVAIGYGINKLQITAVVEDDKVGVDDLSEQITGFEEYVQSVDVASFNKL
ncbi:Translation elongation factor 1 beta [Physocladia obscura]|uniref:Translation elongation factor 1 beta n=1 Tax=Physocladia obscura TaxID=109957 RepID=A0AAD5SXH1_9FUNG|nr:Translation elongation factor 1 beta [Physocladia obscura]